MQRKFWSIAILSLSVLAGALLIFVSRPVKQEVVSLPTSQETINSQKAALDSKIAETHISPSSIFLAGSDTTVKENDLAFVYGNKDTRFNDIKPLVVISPFLDGKAYRIFGAQRIAEVDEMAFTGQCYVGVSGIQNNCSFQLKSLASDTKSATITFTSLNRPTIFLTRSNKTQQVNLPPNLTDLYFNIGAVPSDIK